MKDSVKLFYLLAIVAIIAINFLSTKSTSSNMITLNMLKIALAECPEGTPPDQDESEASISCKIWCDAHDTSLAYHWVYGTEVICRTGCTDCTPVDCDAEECQQHA